MALIDGSKVDFDDVRLIICLNGFTINERYQIVELGFWSRKLSGVIPFKVYFLTISIQLFMKIFLEYKGLVEN